MKIGPVPIFLQVVLRPGEDLFLDVWAEHYEVVGVSGDTDQEIAVFFRVLESVLQHGFIDNVELNMVSALIEVTADERCSFVKVLLRLEALRVDFNVE